MKILLTADPELPVPPKLYGGIERVIDVLVRELQARGHEIGLVAHRESTVVATRLFPWPGLHSQNRWDALRNTGALWRATRQFQPDVVHSFSRLAYLSPLFLQSSILRLRSPRMIMSYQRQPTERQVARAARLAGPALTFTGCSEHICREGRRGGGNWHAIPNCVELGKYTFQPDVKPAAPLVFLSRVERIKGAHTAIAVAKRTGRRLTIAGNHGESGEEGRYWQKEILPYLGKDGIEYVGPVDDVQKNQLLGQAAAMLVPIEWEEPFGIVFAEALACGTPVISCPRGALPEIVREGVDGFLVNNAEQACAAVEKLPAINRADCRQRAEAKFSSGAVTERYLELYSKLSPHSKFH
ncbi:MAG TPA: glycosyltransferase [Verrucomicrobiae bacterium]|nr:glycosyltransferase [Verrucomicrobiae bacterium]